jgi:hypothetical protein
MGPLKQRERGAVAGWGFSTWSAGVAWHFCGGIRMSKERNDRIPALVAALFVAFATAAGCESKGPAETAGKSVDKGIQDVKDAVNPPGRAEKAGRAFDGALKQ